MVYSIPSGGRIDHAHHGNLAKKSLHETMAMSDAVQKVLDLTSEEDTLLVVTADHSHAFTLQGYSESHTNILSKYVENHLKRFLFVKYPYLILSNVYALAGANMVDQMRIFLKEIFLSGSYANMMSAHAPTPRNPRFASLQFWSRGSKQRLTQFSFVNKVCKSGKYKKNNY